MTTEEAIRTIEHTISDFKRYLPLDYTAKLDEALTALCAQAEAEKNEPLTLEELRMMDGEPIWVDFIGGEGYWDLVRCHNSEFFVASKSGYLLWSEYGKTWLIYRHKPKEGGKMSKWISVEYSLPETNTENDEYDSWEESGPVLVFCRNGRISVANYGVSEGKTYWDGYGLALDKITHWMPLPDPPGRS